MVINVRLPSWIVKETPDSSATFNIALRGSTICPGLLVDGKTYNPLAAERRRKKNFMDKVTHSNSVIISIFSIK